MKTLTLLSASLLASCFHQTQTTEKYPASCKRKAITQPVQTTHEGDTVRTTDQPVAVVEEDEIDYLFIEGQEDTNGQALEAQKAAEQAEQFVLDTVSPAQEIAQDARKNIDDAKQAAEEHAEEAKKYADDVGQWVGNKVGKVAKFAHDVAYDTKRNTQKIGNAISLTSKEAARRTKRAACKIKEAALALASGAEEAAKDVACGARVTAKSVVDDARKAGQETTKHLSSE